MKISGAGLHGLFEASTTIGYNYSSKPKIIIILTDDQGYDDFNIYGASGYSNPNLDQIKKG